MDFPTLAIYFNVVTAALDIVAGSVCALLWRKTTWRWFICLCGALIGLYEVVSYYFILTNRFPPTNPPLNVVLLRPVSAFWHLVFLGSVFLVSTVERAMSDADCQERVRELENRLDKKIYAIELKDKTIEFLHQRISNLEEAQDSSRGIR